MKLKMYTPDGSVIIETDDVTQFYPEVVDGIELTRVDSLTGSVLVNHDLLAVTQALSISWVMDEKREMERSV